MLKRTQCGFTCSNLGYYHCTTGPIELLSQELYYDNAQKYQATLTINATYSTFQSLNFLYQSKSGVLENMCLRILNGGNNNLIFDVVTKAGRQNGNIPNCAEIIASLKNSVAMINQCWEIVSSNKDSTFELKHLKTLLQKYESICRKGANASKEDFVIDMVKKTLETEAVNLKSMIDAYAEEYSEKSITLSPY